MKFLSSIFFITLPFSLIAGTVNNKHFVSHSSGEGMVVFIKPRKMAKAPSSAAVKPLIYDITLNTLSDTVAVTYTLIARSPSLQIDSTALNNSLKYPNERIFIEPKSNKWIYRLRFKMSEEDFKNSFCDNSALELKVDNCAFIIPEAKKPKEADIFKTTLTLINLNKK